MKWHGIDVGAKIRNSSNILKSASLNSGVITFTKGDDTTTDINVGTGGSTNMSQAFSSLTNSGEFQDGARLITGAYGTSPTATAGTLVSFDTTNVAAVGAQSTDSAAGGMITIVTDAGNADELLVEGIVKVSSNTGWSSATKGERLYMSTTAGQVTTSVPTTSGDYVRVVGYVVDASSATIYFKPDNTWIEL